MKEKKYFEEKWTSKIHFGTKVDYVKAAEAKGLFSADVSLFPFRNRHLLSLTHPNKHIKVITQTSCYTTE